MIPIGALWERPDGHGFSGNIDFTPLNTRIAVLPAQKEQRISTVAMRTDKAPVLLLFGAANKKSPLVNIGALWHTNIDWSDESPF